MTTTERRHAHAAALSHYNALKDKGLSIDATRGKPSTAQVELSLDMLSPLPTYNAKNGTDTLNYGGNDGLPEMKQLFSDMLDIPPDNIIVGGNSSLQMMFDCVANLRLCGAWKANQKLLCPSPGYDRHFAIAEYFNLTMIPIAMSIDGPDMDAVEDLVKDPDVVGMWCVPVFSNPQGYIYSDTTIKRLAKMHTACDNFKLLWDNAYTVHHLNGKRPRPVNIMTECELSGHDARPIVFTSFSKISIPGAAVVCMAATGEMLTILKKRFATQTIGPDKINQLRHVHFFRDLDTVISHMQKHADILRPKFEKADAILKRELATTGASFTTPDGGYFISIETTPHCAKRVWQLCKDAGLLLTDAGATFPYGVDVNDTNLRFAPSFISLDEVEAGVEILCAAIQLAAVEDTSCNA